MADDTLDFLKGFSAEDYDLDLGISFVDEKPETAAAAEAVEAIGTKVENLGVLKPKLIDCNLHCPGLRICLISMRLTSRVN